MSDRVADTLREAILDNELKPGQRISVRTISKQLEVSETPVKEALKILKAEGLINVIPRKGTIISDFCRKNLESTAFIRSSLEGVAAFYAATNISPEELAELNEILVKVHESRAEGDVQSIVVLNTQFHGAIHRASRNEYLIRQIEALRSFDITFRKHALAIGEELEWGGEEHHAILKALESRDAALAERLVVAHIRRTARKVLDMTKPQNPEDQHAQNS